MIIEIDSSAVGALESSKSNTKQMVELFSDVFTSIGRGNNLFRIKKGDLLKLSKDYRLSEFHRNIAKIESNQATFRAALDDAFDFKVKIYHSDFEANLKENDINIDVKNYSDLKQNYEISFLDKPIVVFENLTDNKIYSKIAEWFISSVAHFRGYKVNYDAYPGGGDSTHSVCKELLEEGRIVFSLVDSDKKYPDDQVGKTAKDTIDVFKNVGFDNAVLVVGVHEVENLIPHSVLEKIARNEQKPLIDFLKAASQLCDMAPKFYDLKSSFSFNTIFEDQHSNFSGYWRPIFENWNVDYETEFRESIDLGKKKLNGRVLNKLSSMLPHAIESFSVLEPCNCPPYVEDEWKKIGNFLLACGISSQPIRI
ncbi:hypothetical protein [Lacimicrobium alkaliphilum]|uniref:Uncharacterized protein n=1 Tax=Lacimicrobium alkaliphilum TaxID=1526571 RepID=A0A0U3AYX2_9ALTE|nr:hypothetical protein [Lacimicrobium alkaliphilum]ALS99311.1 hypothetical protein AT746_14295 [Lacimicrobium alkaliphilum]